MAKQDNEEVLQELTSLMGKDRARTDSKGRKHLTVMGASGASRVPWFEYFTPEEIEAKFAENYRRIKKAEASAKKPNRPLNALLIATSGRNDKLSCAHEKSRSTEVLNVAKKRLEELGVNEITYYDLWDLNIEHCNGCYGTEDYWCHWPCTCWPFDDGQKIYEAVIRADIIVFGSPVNEATAASRFYEMWHRMICVDGGMDFKPSPGWEKSTDELEKMRRERGHGVGLEHTRRFLGKKLGFIILGHELGAQLAASTIHASAQYRGAYIPAGAQVAKVYRGSGPNSTDRETLHNAGVFRRELMHEVDGMCEQLVRAAKLDRKQPHKEEPAERS